MLTVKETAETLRLSQAAIYRYIASGQLECHRFGNAIRIAEGQLADFLERTKDSGKAAPFSVSIFKHL